ncbi:MAG: DUF481 domain-containing protein [Candidatus Hydrogenedentes bacterium]|nr:DUF481 domain-containing protein [Candidatus Hydrogenedentota bacterium]
MPRNPRPYLPCAILAHVAAVLIVAVPVLADTLYLDNGDVITGQLAGLDAGKLRFTAPYVSGELEVSAEALRYIASDQPLQVTLSDGRQFEGALFVTDDTQMLETPAGIIALSQGEIAALRPLGGHLAASSPAEATPAAEAEAVAAAAPVAEDAPAEEPKPKLWSGSLESGLALRSGSTDRLDLNLGTALTRKTDRHTLTLNFNAAYAEVEDVINTRQYKGEGKWQYYPRERLYLYWLVGGESDDARKLDLRVNTALGLGYDFVKQEKRTWSADIGVDYAYERWNPFTPEERDGKKQAERSAALASLRGLLDQLGAGLVLDRATLQQAWTSALAFRDPLALYDEREEYQVSLRAGTEFSQSIFEKGTLSESLVVFPSLDDMGEFRATSTFSFTTPLSEKLGLKIDLLTEYDSLADKVDADAWQNTLTTGLRYEF